jgi:hypothetical protein
MCYRQVRSITANNAACVAPVCKHVLKRRLHPLSEIALLLSAGGALIPFCEYRERFFRARPVDYGINITQLPGRFQNFLQHVLVYFGGTLVPDR